jgi:hypothetical protein
MKGFRIRHMTWNSAGEHFHPVDVTFERPDGSVTTTSARDLPFAIEGDVTVETEGVVVRSSLCTSCGQSVFS